MLVPSAASNVGLPEKSGLFNKLRDLRYQEAPKYFRTYEQVKAAMFELQAKYPNLVEVRDIGDTWEKTKGMADRDVLALVLTNRSGRADKPSSLHIGGTHAREIANPELLMTFATQQLEGYGRDPEATMLLDTRETVLVPILNADGHAVVERGHERQSRGDTMHRKNTSMPKNGVDLNRNYDFRWGGPGSDSYQRGGTYRGPSPASEPETQAVQNYVREHRPGMFVDWHSFSGMNLFPWGDTYAKAKDFNSLRAIARAFTSMNGYKPRQSMDLYKTSGTSIDYVYGTHRIPALIVETGNKFQQTDKDFAETLRDNLPVLAYASKIADAPFARVHGPRVEKLGVTLAATGAQTVQLKAVVSDAKQGGQELAAAEYTLDAFAAPGSGTALQAADGSFDSESERVVGTMDAASGQRQLIYVRGKDSDGNWGPLSAQWLEPAAT